MLKTYPYKFDETKKQVVEKYSAVCEKYKIKPVHHIFQQETSKKTVLVRVDFNVPVNKQACIIDDLRIRSAAETINLLLAKNATVVLASHFQDPQDNFDRDIFSFSRILAPISQILNCDVYLSKGATLAQIGTELNDFRLGENSRKVFLMDNIRFFPEERHNDVSFAQELIKNLSVDSYVNDAFSVSHRKHASIVAVPQSVENTFAGISLLKELYMLEETLGQAWASEKNVTAIFGGKKIATKMPLLKKLGIKVSNIIIIGGMANTFLKARGLNIGRSFYEPEMLETAKGLDAILPVDFVDQSGQIVAHLSDDSNCCDIGPATVAVIDKIISQSDLVIWNGPAGICEDQRFAVGTESIAASIAKHEVKTVLGGGETAAVVNRLKLEVAHISSGGGAFLAWLENPHLEGIKSIKVQK